MTPERLTPLQFAYRYLGLLLYPWQAEFVQASARQGKRSALCAANGSGKTAACNVVLLLWFLYTFPKGRAVVTSGSWTQLKNQLWPNLRKHEHLLHAMFGWRFNDTKITTPQGGFISAFSTKEPGRAEGYHQDLAAGAPVMIMVDEAKSVPEPIFEALSRCSPTFYILTSSPGAPSGTFYKAFREPSWAGMYYKVQVTFDMCPHLPLQRKLLAQTIYGPDYERHPVYRSMIMGEFTEGDDAMIIPRYLLMRLLQHKPAPRNGQRWAGVDWAAGGDETVLAVRNGNQLAVEYHSRERDTTRSAEAVVNKCRALGLAAGHTYGDVGGIGLGIMQAAAKMHGFVFCEFAGGAPGADPDHYKNLNIEAWYGFRQSLERGEVHFNKGLDDETIRQLTDRYLMWDDRGKLRCEKKRGEMDKRGVPSPDRADALVMAWWAGRYMTYDDEEIPPLPPQQGYFAPAPMMTSDFVG